jgi:ribonuclease HII
MAEVTQLDPWLYEHNAQERGYSCVAGVDEAGRGPLAGPVVAAAVVLPRSFNLEGIKDSKKMTPLQRQDAYERIMAEAVAVGVGIIHSEEIDRINILQATYQSMRSAIASLSVDVDYVLVDGYPIPRFATPQEGIIKGDSLSISISSASIIAKVTRDRIMEEMDLRYPGYGFARHKGYCTPEHLTAIYRLGVCEIHRKCFSPISEQVKRSCQQPNLF